MPKQVPDGQEMLDREDAQLRLDRLADALVEEAAAKEVVKSLQQQLRRAEAAYKAAQQRTQELAWVEKRLRIQRKGKGEGNEG